MNRFAAAAAVAVCGSLGACGGAGGGATPRLAFSVGDFPAGPAPIRVAIGDVNGDGVPDCVVLRDGNSSVGVFLGARGPRQTVSLDGSWKTTSPSGAAHVLVWDTAKDLALADVDGDGALDLVVSGGSANEIGIWRGDKAHPGELLSPLLLAATNSGPIQIGDLDRNGRLDIACLDESTGQLTLLRQTAPMSFTLDLSPPLAGACTGLFMVDMDRDGMPDLVTNRPAGGVVFIWHQTAGPFAAVSVPVSIPTGAALAVDDLDQDLWPDMLLVGHALAGHTSRQVAALLQDRSSPLTFHEVDTDLGIAIDESGVHVADMDGDGAADLVLDPLDADSDGDLVVYFSSQANPGSFDAPGASRLKISNADGSRGLVQALVDMDGDGGLDVVEADTAHNGVVVLVVDGIATKPVQVAFQRQWQVDTTGPTVSMALADLDRDGSPDLVVCSDDGSVAVRYGDGTASFPVETPVAKGVSPGIRVAAADVNGDGRADLIVLNRGSGTVTIYMHTAGVERGFNPPSLLAVPAGPGSPTGLAVADVDGDGWPDIVVSESTAPGKVALFRQVPGVHGTYLPAVEIAVGLANPNDVTVGDLDGDGLPDLALCADGSCGVILRDPTGPLKWMAPELLLLAGGDRVAKGDVNGDGRADLVVCGPLGVLVALQDPLVPGRFLPSFAVSTEPSSGLALGDLDRDGRLDVTFTEAATALVRCVDPEADGDGTQAVRLNGLPPGEPVTGTLVVVGDLDGDGSPDVVVSTPATALVTPMITSFTPSR